jgi:hypothetical protein
MIDAADKTVSTDHDDTATVWPQAGNDAKGVRRCGPEGNAGLVPII